MQLIGVQSRHQIITPSIYVDVKKIIVKEFKNMNRLMVVKDTFTKQKEDF